MAIGGSGRRLRFCGGVSPIRGMATGAFCRLSTCIWAGRDWHGTSTLHAGGPTRLRIIMDVASAARGVGRAFRGICTTPIGRLCIVLRRARLTNTIKDGGIRPRPARERRLLLRLISGSGVVSGTWGRLSLSGLGRSCSSRRRCSVFSPFRAVAVVRGRGVMGGLMGDVVP